MPPASRGGICIVPPRRGTVHCAGRGSAGNPASSGRPGPDRESPTGSAFQTGEPVISNYLEGESRIRTPDVLREHGVGRAINLLIQGEGQPCGVIGVDSPTDGRLSTQTFVA
ncbi:GAF domain-containing protein [Methylorubrum extorquens]|uniref:GAF domain-containing protein n=1 Tax=Methylorubrum extorquens TaxID=408 RepID=UPI0001629867|nr:signal transduction histidine kinase [Methylorubrum extorquens PA1]WIU38376.1 GAF domain-containing protein [Methylorubrum extorquens]